ncbi:MAG: hypothetical protein ACLQVD_06415 [Capsulimonadaceae bacterium]
MPKVLFHGSPKDGLPSVFEVAQMISFRGQQTPQPHPNYPNTGSGHVAAVNGVSTPASSTSAAASGVSGGAGLARLTIVNGCVAAIAPLNVIAASGSTYSVAVGDDAVNCDAGSGAMTVSLPAAAGAQSVLFFTKTDSTANSVTLTAAGSDLINGAPTYTLSPQYAVAILVSDGVGEWIVYGAGASLNVTDGTTSVSGVSTLLFTRGKVTSATDGVAEYAPATATSTSLGEIQLAGALGGPGTTAAAPVLSSTGVTAATYGDSAHVGQFTVGLDGRVTAASTVAIAFPAWAFDETVSGSGTTYTLAHPASPTGSLDLRMVSSAGASLLVQGSSARYGYTLSGSTVTLGNALPSGYALVAKSYQYVAGT